LAYLCKHPNIAIVKGELIIGVSITIVPSFFSLSCIGGNKYVSCARSGK
jgi:hypothetical protein